MGTGGSFPRIELPGRAAHHSPPSNPEVKNAWSYTSTSNTSSWRGAYLNTGTNSVYSQGLGRVVKFGILPSRALHDFNCPWNIFSVGLLFHIGKTKVSHLSNPVDPGNALHEIQGYIQKFPD
jgi:hypothetical protein